MSTDFGHQRKILITNRISTLHSILDEEHMNVVNGEITYEQWRKTNSRLLRHYCRYLRSAKRLKATGVLCGSEADDFIKFCHDEKYVAKSRTDAVRRIMKSRLAEIKTMK